MQTSIKKYIENAPLQSREKLREIYSIASGELPDSEEVISYQIPCFRKDGKNIIYFAGWKKHVSIYPIPSGDAEYRDVIKPFVAGRGTLKFPLDKPLPVKIIKDTLKFRLRESFVTKGV